MPMPGGKVHPKTTPRTQKRTKEVGKIGISTTHLIKSIIDLTASNVLFIPGLHANPTEMTSSTSVSHVDQHNEDVDKHENSSIDNIHSEVLPNDNINTKVSPNDNFDQKATLAVIKKIQKVSVRQWENLILVCCS